ncbi:muramidase [Pseudomonas nitroreducens]|uniref:muramidase n=1 Tax=Pseudomonas nitroreducens TaxID=46680 RepID=UPI003CC82A42
MPVVLDVSPAPLPEPVVCSIMAALKYELPVNVLLAVAGQEAGKPGQWVRNSNGTYDVGPMQFNTGYLRELARYGITPGDVEKGGCYSYELAAWRIRGHVRNDSGDLWTRVANYHSRTPPINARYRRQIMHRSADWADWLEARFATQPINLQSIAAIADRKADEVKPQARALSRPAHSYASPSGQNSYVPRQLWASGQP